MIQTMSEEEIKKIISMGEYWEEVNKRQDKTPLKSELRNIVDLLGTNLLWVILERAKDEDRSSITNYSEFDSEFQLCIHCGSYHKCGECKG